MENPDMLAFTYRIQKIIRDLKHLDMHTPEDEACRETTINALTGVCEQINNDFS